MSPVTCPLVKNNSTYTKVRKCNVPSFVSLPKLDIYLVGKTNLNFQVFMTGFEKEIPPHLLYMNPKLPVIYPEVICLTNIKDCIFTFMSYPG